MDQMQERFQLEITRLRLQNQQREATAAQSQAKYDLREAQTAQTAYSGSFRRFRDRLTGKQEAAETELRHAVQNAETQLSATRQVLEQLNWQIPETESQLSALPDWDSLNDGSTQWYRLDALYTIEVLHPLLKVNLELLTERRNQFNGTYAGQLKTRQTLMDIYSAPEEAGEACRPYLLRLKAALDALEIPFALPPYFDSPTAFLSFATKYTRMDRVNAAIGQVQALTKQLPDLQKQLNA